MAVGDLVEHQHQAGGEDGAFHLLAAELEEVRQGGAVGLVHLAAIALVEQGGLRQHRGAARCGHQHGVRTGDEHLQALPGDRGVLALEAFVGHQLDAVLGGQGAHYLGPVLAIGVGGADEAQGLHAARAHVFHQGLGDQVVVLGGLEHPLLLFVHRQHHGGGAHRRQQRHAGLGDELDNAHGVGRTARADDGVDVLFADQLLQRLDGSGGVAAVIQRDVGHLLVAGLGGQQRRRVLLRKPDQGEGTSGGGDDADLHIRLGDGQAGGAEEQGGHGLFEEHDVLRGLQGYSRSRLRSAPGGAGARTPAAFLLFWRLLALPAGIPLDGSPECSSRARKTCAMPVRLR
ncbi:hypothetical protein D9M68_565280 [compost metagenome]